MDTNVSKYEINPINIFPNPIDENLYINLDRQYKNAVVSIVDVNGNYDNIYDFIREPLKGHENEKNNKSAIKNLEYIKQHFEKLGYKSIVQKITNDMQDA